MAASRGSANRASGICAILISWLVSMRSARTLLATGAIARVLRSFAWGPYRAQKGQRCGKSAGDSGAVGVTGPGWTGPVRLHAGGATEGAAAATGMHEPEQHAGADQRREEGPEGVADVQAGDGEPEPAQERTERADDAVARRLEPVGEDEPVGEAAGEDTDQQPDDPRPAGAGEAGHDQGHEDALRHGGPPLRAPRRRPACPATGAKHAVIRAQPQGPCQRDGPRKPAEPLLSGQWR